MFHDSQRLRGWNHCFLASAIIDVSAGLKMRMDRTTAAKGGLDFCVSMIEPIVA
jgi:hypothetical protein